MNEEIKRAILQKCESMEIPVVGIANVERWFNPPFLPWMPKEFYPQSIYPEARSVIVIGLPIPLPVLETSPSIHYRELYNTVNTLLDQYSYRLANYLTDRGYPSIFVPRDGYGSIRVLLENPVAFFSHRHAAFLAGLGTSGFNNMILPLSTGPGYALARYYQQRISPRILYLRISYAFIACGVWICAHLKLSIRKNILKA